MKPAGFTLKALHGDRAKIAQLRKDLDQSQDKALCWEEQAERLQHQNDAAIEELRSELAERDALNSTLDAVAKVANEAEKLVIYQREKIETLHRHIADIGEAMRTKANNNPDGVKSSTLEMLGEELLAALPSNALFLSCLSGSDADELILAEQSCERMAKQIRQLTAERDAFKAALEKLACLGNGDSYGNSVGNCIAQEALKGLK